MVVTRVVFHFEMSPLNAAAPLNAAGVHVNAVVVEPEHKKKRKPKIVRKPQRSWNKQLNKKTKRWKLDVLNFIVVTRAVSHFEMSALNAAAESNAVGVHVNAVAVEPEEKKKRKLKIVKKPQKLMEQAIEQEDKERWMLDVLRSMVVTRAVFHCEMSTLNKPAPKNAVGVHVNAVAVEPEQEKKNTQNC